MAEIDHPRSRSAWASTSSPCVSMETDSFELACLVAVSFEGVRLPLVDLSVAHPTAHRWGDSVINSEEVPLIAGTASDTIAPNDGQRHSVSRQSGGIGWSAA